MGENLDSESHVNSIKKDWVRRFKKFAANYFDENLAETELCLKDVYLLHRWERITRSIKPVAWENLKTQRFVDADTLGSQACVGGAGGSDGCLI